MNASEPTRQVTAVDVGDVRIAVHETRPAEALGLPVLALHGLASTAATWNHVATALARGGRRVLALDQRGHGRSTRPGRYAFPSMRDDVLATLDAFDLDAVDLIGHSMGGHVATLVAQLEPTRVRRLVLEDTPAPPRVTAREGRPPLVGLAGTLRSAFVVTRVRQFDVRAARPVIAQLSTPDPGWWAALPTMTAPTLLISGGPRSHVPEAVIREVAARLPDARVATVPSAGHRVHSTRPAEFLALVAPFVHAVNGAETGSA